MKSTLKTVFAGLFLAAIFGFLGWLIVPSLWTDWQIRDQQLVEATDIQISEGKCRTKVFVLSFCEIEFTDTANEKHSFFYFITGMNSNETFSVMRSSTDNSVYTTTLGMAYFYDRLLSFLGGVVILLVIVYAGVKSLFSPREKLA